MKHRFFVETSEQLSDFALLEPEEAQHAQRVLRLTEGDEIEALDGVRVYHAQLEYALDGRLGARLLQVLPPHEPIQRVTLFQGLPKGDKMDFIVQKATEVGVDTVIPVRFGRCVARPEEKAALKSQNRWQRIAREATKQCGRAWVPQIELPITVEDLTRRIGDYDFALIPWEEAQDTSIAQAIGDHHAGTVALIIGPEGGMDEGEVAALRQQGAKPVTLGSRILRTETAGMTALILLLGRSGVLE